MFPHRGSPALGPGRPHLAGPGGSGIPGESEGPEPVALTTPRAAQNLA